MGAPRVLLLGAPGAGKGTQSRRLVDEFDIEHVTTGDALRANKDMETEYGTPREYMDAGDLVPDPVVNEIVEAALSDAEGFVLDGYPRNESQTEYLDDITDLDAVLYLEVAEAELVERITGRRVCEDCGANYHVEFNPPEEPGVCDECGGDLYQRDDDTEEVARDRIDTYRENTEPVVEYFREKGTLVEIDGEQTPEEVWEDVRAAVADRTDP
ncbi:adenylate kinase [Halanaeroarchaeum sulfurireducens]|uniref:Adenylate kinase n=1 Tax=Halanaeroarchaeum sulfurireducens TaxID=1604004 RepID=A0A0F7PG35_9EURY|nr:adenylate kinase [Halanaeroarchaeum sulfurireducens]AKH98233.1 adenylate kinase [Halanaeroarchaeum sulfurireducens]ALG82627.1 adenylate kinase [Halanaeroarchaeum sulfurireducens]